MRWMFGSMLALGCVIGAGKQATADNTNNILITGYWPPSNEMLRSFSRSPMQNPTGWVGRNWEGRGYDVHAYFPEFPNGMAGANGRGVGDLEVDYQDTVTDWARIIEEVHPVAIITFSRANTVRGWELEPAAQRWKVNSGEANPPGRTVALYTTDYLAPTRPTDAALIAEPVGNIRNNSLPMQQIVNAVAAAMTPAQIDPFVQTYDPLNPAGFDFGGGFLSGYASYLGCWHHDLNAGPGSAYQCVAAGHIHVGGMTLVPDAVQATQITLRTLIEHIGPLATICRADWNDSTDVTVQDIFDYLGSYFANDGDFNNDGATSVQDVFDYLGAYFAGCG